MFRANDTPISLEWAQNEVKRLCEAVIGRSPEPEFLARESASISAGTRAPSDLVIELLATRGLGPASTADVQGLVYRTYRVVLGREPDASGSESYEAALRAGNIDTLEMVSELMSSAEFSDYCIRTPAVARRISAAIINALRPQSADGARIEAYSAALENGMALHVFIQEVLSTPEYRARISGETSGHSDKHGIGVETGADKLASSIDETLVNRAYEIVLGRKPDPSGKLSYEAALATGERDILDIIEELIESAEFGVRSIRSPGVSRFLTEVAISTLMRRQPSEEAIAAYAKGLQDGRPFDVFLGELISSDEFRTLFGKTESDRSDSNSPGALGELALELIADRLVRDGCKLSTAPSREASDKQLDNRRMRSMLLTLAMLADASV